MPEIPDHSALLTYAETRDLLRVPRGTLYAWVHRGVIPHVRLGPRSVRFRRADLDAWIESRRVGPGVRDA